MPIHRKENDSNSYDCKFLRELLQLISEYCLYGDFIWHKDLSSFGVLCNDTFYYSSADAEEVTAESLPLLRQAIEETDEIDGLILYCARQRKMRPLAEVLNSMPKEHRAKFDDISYSPS